MLKIVVAAALAVTPLALVTAPGASAAPPPSHTLRVSGTGVGMYPAYSQNVHRYAATTLESTFPSDSLDNTTNLGASVTVHATTTDPRGKVLVNGVPLTSGQIKKGKPLHGLDAGDEISVIYVDSGGREADSVFVLPALFPTMSKTIDKPGVAPGKLFLTLSQFFNPPAPAQPYPLFETVVDNNGVPTWVRTSRQGGFDLKLQPNGHVSVSRGGVPGQIAGSTSFVELNDQFQPVNSFHTLGHLTHTDNHDSILEPDGSRVLLAYQPNQVTGNTDAVIQEVDADGNVTFQWDSSALVGETVAAAGNKDYAHINSVQIVDDGQDFLASFRHLSSVIKIARLPHDGFAPGDIVWKLGGRDSSWTFPDDPAPFPGPCAQHTASQLPDGDIMVFDDGSVSGFGDFCVDPADPLGPPHERGQSRIAVYRLHPDKGTATLVSSYGPPGRFTFFMGSAQYLAPSGHTMIGWAASTQALATEVAADQTTGAMSPVWELKAEPSPDQHTYFSYRSLKFQAPDATDPRATVGVPQDNATYEYGENVPTDFSCTDTGGSTLQTCGSVLPGTPLNTSKPGVHTFTVTATDGAGNATSVVRHYTVGELVFRPDLSVRQADGTWLGTRVFGTAATQTTSRSASAGKTVTVPFRLANRGNHSDRCLVHGRGGSEKLGASYRFGGIDVTDQVVAGTWRTPATAAGTRQVLTLRVHIAGGLARGATRTFKVRCSSTHASTVTDAAGLRVTVH
jgi:arylsulfotransferase ASST